MTLAEQILQEIEQLLPEQQRAVLDYATLVNAQRSRMTLLNSARKYKRY